MKVHRIELTEAPRDKAHMFYEGEKLGNASPHPLFTSARRLLASGRAQPGDRIETWRGGGMCLAGPIEAAAKLTVNSAGRFMLHRPFRWMPLRRDGMSPE